MRTQSSSVPNVETRAVRPLSAPVSIRTTATVTKSSDSASLQFQGSSRYSLSPSR
jgi:hypothetical protein